MKRSKEKFLGIILTLIMAVSIFMPGITSNAAANAAGDVTVTYEASGQNIEQVVNISEITAAVIAGVGKDANHLYSIDEGITQSSDLTAADALIMAWLKETGEDTYTASDIAYTWYPGYTYDGVTYPDGMYFSTFNGVPGSTGNYYLVSEEDGVYTYYWAGTSLTLYIDGQEAANYANCYKMSEISSVDFVLEYSETDPFTTTYPIEGALPAPTN